jgi:hypothetical protein
MEPAVSRRITEVICGHQHAVHNKEELNRENKANDFDAPGIGSGVLASLHRG